ncbi:MAG: undecaprenyl/decaprenyl-phosphate alpha-N-acetylglucosaminyl 1-phosphate transferase [Candidatus Omnitrophica bacterium]|jgi:UDP-GlcNAc:undecaprenyl-phosphate GlcNAc-1-phosphate transferase|nr:undecaprenyl/decaprenyl-phosphate alpha-N-acetylglucosaminyl 1-phosphate transferase [Candidatus Omnitrophota bacterium]
MIYFFICSISFIIVYLITPNIRYAGIRFSAFDKKGERKIHKKVITKLGGLAVYLGFLGGVLSAFIFDLDFLRMHILQISGLFIGSFLMLLLGMYDDFQGSSANIKLTIQIIIALLVVKLGFRLERIAIPGLPIINLGMWSVPVTLLWVVGITNAINLIDGLDGLATGITAIVVYFFCLYAIILQDQFAIYVALALLGASLAFLKYNFYPAKIFLGDTGSLFMGFVVANLAIHPFRTTVVNNLFFPCAVIVLFLPIVDTSLAVVRRILRRQHIFKGDFSHIHHYYIKLGFNQPQAVKRLYAITFYLGIISLICLISFQPFK